MRPQIFSPLFQSPQPPSAFWLRPCFRQCLTIELNWWLSTHSDCHNLPVSCRLWQFPETLFSQCNHATDAITHKQLWFLFFILVLFQSKVKMPEPHNAENYDLSMPFSLLRHPGHHQIRLLNMSSAVSTTCQPLASLIEAGDPQQNAATKHKAKWQDKNTMPWNFSTNRFNALLPKFAFGVNACSIVFRCHVAKRHDIDG